MRLNLLNLRSSNAVSNKGSFAMQRAFKYKQVGIYKNLLFIDGKREDFYVGILSRDDYLKNNKVL